MNIEVFLKLYNTKRTDGEKQKAISQIMNNVHVSYEEKVNRTGLIAKQCYHTKKKDLDGVEHEVFEQNSAAKYMLYSLTLVDLYTKLDIDYKKALEQFEMINGEILDKICAAINEREHQEFQMLLDFACDDIMVNEYELHSFVREQVDRFSSLLGAIVAPAIENLDIDKIKEVIGEFNLK